MLLMLMEFIVIHSAAFMGVVGFSKFSWWRKTLGIVGLGLFYSIFVGGFSLAFETWWPFIAFWCLVGNRLAGAVVGAPPEGQEMALIQSGWAVSALCYLLLTFATTLLPMPRFGISEAVRNAANLPGSGVWVSEPHRVIALGTLYFFLQAYVSFRPETMLKSK